MVVDKLFEGNVDIVGDVHGEMDHLTSLLEFLGYDSEGQHRHGRRLVFVGDLVDRGPNSPAVVRLVRKLVDAGRAQCVLGNHEFNIIRNDAKEGNEWILHDHPDSSPPRNQQIVDAQIRSEFVEFFRGLPLALQHDKLRVVHACWDDSLLSVNLEGSHIDSHSDLLANEIDQRIRGRADFETLKSQANTVLLSSRETEPTLVKEWAELSVQRQNQHPIKVATSGKEAVADKPFWAGGKWRFEQRVKWWNDYNDKPLVVVGHYWRNRDGGSGKHAGPDLFEDVSPFARLGHGRVMCVDYSVGHCYRQRAKGETTTHALAAFQWPENHLVFSDGLRAAVTA